MRFALAVGLLLVAAAVSAQETPKTAPKPIPPGDQCLADIPAVRQYADTMKATRDSLEQTVAILRAENARLRAQIETMKAKPAEPK